MVKKPENEVSIKTLETALLATCGIADSIRVYNDWQRLCARVGWTIDVVLLNGDTHEARVRAWKAIELYCDAVGRDKLALNWSGKPSALTGARAQKQIAQYKPQTLDSPEGFAMMLQLVSGDTKDFPTWENNAQDYRFRCSLNNTEWRWYHDKYDPEEKGAGSSISYMRIHLPVNWMLEHPPERNVGWLSDQIVEIMQPLWATAGWGIMSAVDERNIGPDGRGQDYVYQVLERFPGINALGSLSMIGTKFNRAMFSVNWKNYVRAELLEQMGGIDKVMAQSQASPHLGVGRLGDVLMVQAGLMPLLGDSQHKLPMAGYGEAARLLKPLRAKPFYNTFVSRHSPRGERNADAVLLNEAYMSRFDAC